MQMILKPHWKNTQGPQQPVTRIALVFLYVVYVDDFRTSQETLIQMVIGVYFTVEAVAGYLGVCHYVPYML
jgi:hypothetical protein